MTAVGVFFGGRSVEHEVSVITALQTMAALPSSYTATPVYIAKSGAWYTGDALRDLERYRDVQRLLAETTRVILRPEPDSRGELVEAGTRRGLFGGSARKVTRIDVAFPLVHGTHGEDGTLAALFELCDIAYAGSGVAASAVSMDKRLAKAALRAAGLRVLDDVLVRRDAWLDDADALVRDVVATFPFPVYVKPLSLGSSIGVSRVTRLEQLRDSVELALAYDTRCLVEPSQERSVEINCAVLGRGADLRASACEQPKASGLLTYADKYLAKGGAKSAAGDAIARGGAKNVQRVIPAPLSDLMTRRVQEMAMAAFRAIGAEGVARVDFLVRSDDEIIVNEINTLPGSLSFYLWEPVGVPFGQLVTRLLEMAQARHEAKERTQYSIDTWLLTGRPAG